MTLSDTSTDVWKPRHAETGSGRGARLRDATAPQTARPSPCPPLAGVLLQALRSLATISLMKRELGKAMEKNQSCCLPVRAPHLLLPAARRLVVLPKEPSLAEGTTSSRKLAQPWEGASPLKQAGHLASLPPCFA